MAKHTKDASTPGQYPTVDDVDRANHLAIQMTVSIDKDEKSRLSSSALDSLKPDYKSFVEEAVKELSVEHQHRIDVTSIEVEKYVLWTVHVQQLHMGLSMEMQRAFGDEYLVSSIPNTRANLELLEPVISTIWTTVERGSDLAGVIALAGYCRSFAQKVHSRGSEWAKDLNIKSIKMKFAYTPMMLKLMCVAYLEQVLNVQDIGEAQIDCLTRDFQGGYGSPSHPTAELEYLVTVPAGNGTYKFEIRGDSRIINLTGFYSGSEVKVKAHPYLNRVVNSEEQSNDPNVPQ